MKPITKRDFQVRVAWDDSDESRDNFDNYPDAERRYFYQLDCMRELADGVRRHAELIEVFHQEEVRTEPDDKEEETLS